MNTLLRFLAPFVFVISLLVGSTAEASVTVTPTHITNWGDEAFEVEWDADGRTLDKEFDEDNTTRDGLDSLVTAAEHLEEGGAVQIEWSLNEEGLYEVDVTLD